MHNLFLLYFVNLYMFRAYLGPSSGRTNVCIQQLVLIILFRWVYVVLVALESNQDNRQKSKLCIKLVFFDRIISRCTVNKTFLKNLCSLIGRYERFGERRCLQVQGWIPTLQTEVPSSSETLARYSPTKAAWCHTPEDHTNEYKTQWKSKRSISIHLLKFLTSVFRTSGVRTILDCLSVYAEITKI